ncbi:MAG: nucleotide sugar dehydrogenase [Halodesulfurarchaeum sp.]
MSDTQTDSWRLYGSTASDETQRSAFRNGDVPVAVYGLGKMGLPLASVYADVTGNTIGVDIDEDVVRSVNDGKSHIKREPGLPELVSSVVGDGSLRAVSDPAVASEEATVHVLMVPTLLNGANEPDLSILTEAVGDLAPGLSPGDLVIVESTVPPRTTADVIVPLMSDRSDLDRGDFGAAACPERTVSGQAIADIRGTHPKVVGGIDAESTRVAALIYDEIVDNRVITTDGAATAEAVKVFEGVYRDVNIGLANQLALYADAMDIDVNEAIDVANSQPFCDIHAPGPGVGGHCIPVYPYFLIEGFDVDSSLLSVARDLNDRMPSVTVSMLEDILASNGTDLAGSRVLVMGLTYKANIEELRNAPSLAIVRELHEREATVMAVDPLLDDWTEFEGVERVPLESATERSVDAVLVVTPHDDFDHLEWERFDAPILDGRRSVTVEDDSVPIYTIGAPGPTV